MAIDKTEKQVRELVEKERGVATRLAADCTGHHNSLGQEDIQHFFPELKQLRGGRWANKAMGVPLSHALMVSSPLVVDLKPFGPAAFENHYGISVSSLQDFVKAGVVKPNLYVRDPNKWRGMDHLDGLISESLVNGERTDTIFQRLRPDFVDCLQNRRDAVAKACDTAEQAVLNELIEELNTDVEGFCQAVGGRWAYLDAIIPTAAADAEKLLSNGKLREAADFIRVHKHMFVSPITTGVGGTFYWGPEDADIIKRVDTNTVPTTYESRHFILNPEMVQFVLRKITGLHRLSVMGHVHSDRLLEFVTNDDYQSITSGIQRHLDDLVSISVQSSVPEERFDDLDRQLKEFQKFLDCFKLGARTMTTATIGGGASIATAAIGHFVDWYVAAAAGVMMSWFVERFTDSWEKSGEMFHKLVRPRQHRILDFEQRTKELRGKT